MKISSSTPNYINQTYANQANAASGQALKSGKLTGEAGTEKLADSINLSSRTKDLQKISKAMETEPVDRQKYVADIKEKVQTNQYNMNAETIAEKMVAAFINEIG